MNVFCLILFIFCLKASSRLDTVDDGILVADETLYSYIFSTDLNCLMIKAIEKLLSL